MLFGEKMLRFIEKPNLPDKKVKLVLAGELYLDMLRLDRFGIQAIGVPPSPDLEDPVASHIDMQVVHLYSNIFLSPYAELCKVKLLYGIKTAEQVCKVENLVELELKVLQGKVKLQRDYPKCAAYNVLLLGNLAIFNPKCLDSTLYNELRSLQYKPVLVRQGFARCSVCVVNEHAVITADTGIAAALSMHGISVLQIAPGYIALPGYDTGFLGGASFKLSSDVLAFTGRMEQHPDWVRIQAFLRSEQVSYLFLTDEPVFDVGTVIPVLEES